MWIPELERLLPPWFFVVFWLAVGNVAALSVTSTSTTVLGVDPEGSARINGESFQQNAITTYNGWQYVAFYNSSGTYLQNYMSLARRQISPSVTSWQTIVFKDYIQSTEDVHNTISVGIAPGDGTIHLSYDHHDVPLNYRVSQTGVATNPSSITWSTSLFGSTVHALPGASGTWTPLTYPRFEAIGSDLLMEFRIGASGAGDSYIYRYSTSSHSWSQVKRYLAGSDNNAYINGFDYNPTSSKLETSWTWRETPDVVTNHDLGYAYSTDFGVTWRNSAGTSMSVPITPTSSGSLVYTIPQNSGILNQEGQASGPSGTFHVLNRETTGGTYRWYHYLRSSSGSWSRTAFTYSGLGTPTATGLRGKMAFAKTGELMAIIPSNTGNGVITLLYSTSAGGYNDWKLLWTGISNAVDPHVDKIRARDSGVLSVFYTTSGGYPARKVQVVDLVLGA